MAEGTAMGLHTILRELHNISGFRLSIYDTKFREIEAYPKEISAYCKLVQSTEAGRGCCLDNDRHAFEQVARNPEVYLYKCNCGLYEAVAPLYILGNIVGYLMMGQSIDSSPLSKETIIRHASRYIADGDAIAAAADEVPVCEKSKILSCMNILDICAQYIMFSNQFHVNTADLPDKVKLYIDNEYSHELTIEGICLKFFCSRATLMKTFKKQYGLGVIEYLTHVRMQAAHRLLAGTDKPVRDVSELCGYPDQNYFCKVFHKHCGMTPSAYRKSCAAALSTK